MRRSNNTHGSERARYWSDYIGNDALSCPYQNETGSDGIGDTPYVVNENNTDHFPLMNPWSPPDIAVVNLTSSKTGVGRGYPVSLDVTVENQGNKVEDFTMDIYLNGTLFYSENARALLWHCLWIVLWEVVCQCYGSVFAEVAGARVLIRRSVFRSCWQV